MADDRAGAAAVQGGKTALLAPPTDARAQASGEAAAPQASGDTTAAAIDREQLAARAYELYLARGGSDGRDMEDWLEAERELRGAPRRMTTES
jgi:hypothetical protein